MLLIEIWFLEVRYSPDYVYCRHKLESEELVTASGGINFRIGKLFGSKQSSEFKKLTVEHIKNLIGKKVIIDAANMLNADEFIPCLSPQHLNLFAIKNIFIQYYL